LDDLWATKSEDVGLIVHTKIFNLCGLDPPTSQTDRQTDEQMTCNRKTTLCTIVHRAVKTTWGNITKLGTVVLYGRTLARIHPEVKRSRLWSVLPAWVCMLIWLL